MNLSEKIKSNFPNSIVFPKELKELCVWVEENDYPISGYFKLYTNDSPIIKNWMGTDKYLNRFGVFGTGPEGSIYAIWKDDSGIDKIVHMGSGGRHLFILAENFLDFLKLLAIGYDEIGFCDLNKLPQESEGFDETCINPNFQNWVTKTFNVTIPKLGSEIVNKEDKSFKNWINKILQK